MSVVAGDSESVGSSFVVAKRQKTANDQRSAAAVQDLLEVHHSNTEESFGSSRRIALNHKEEAETWLSAEIERSQHAYLREGPQYSPWPCKKNGTIPIAHMENAFEEYRKRFFGRSTTSSHAVLLVATGVNVEWMPGEEVGCARFLLFPELGRAKKSALFLTYMPGPEHGAGDSWFVRKLSAWHDANEILDKYCSSGGLSSGAYRHFQPDKRVFPFKKFRDHSGRDVDRANKGNPYSRFIWEIEYENRDPVEIRERGKCYMEPALTRLFFAVKLYAPGDDEKYEAAAVLWGKNETNDEISVMTAVSFGTADLSNDHKHEFHQRRADRLVGVEMDTWERPQVNDASWLITIPFRGFLYKVSKGKPQEGENITYVLDEIEEGAVDDLVIDLRGLVNEHENQLLH